MAVLQLLNATFVLIVAGQSNTHYGAMLERGKDDLDFSRVLQIPSQGNPQLTAVHEGNIGHFSKQLNKIGFITRTAVFYRDNHVDSNGRVVIVPAGFGGSGWGDRLYNTPQKGHWRADGYVFQNLVTRINYAREQLFGNFPAFLWHQGESDVGTPNYKYILQTFIASMREHIGILDCPFVLGEMPWNWVVQDNLRVAHQLVIKSVVFDVPHTSVVSSNGLHSTAGDLIHFSAADQRVLGKRYYNSIAIAKANKSPEHFSPASQGAHVILNHQISTGGHFANVLEAYYYGSEPTDPKYSRLGELWKYRNKDGWYKLQLLAWPIGKSITWRQKINPLGSSREGYTPIQILENSLNITESRFQGLYVKGGTAANAIPTLLTADTDPTRWFFAVGSVRKFGSPYVHPLNQSPLITSDHITLRALID